MKGSRRYQGPRRGSHPNYLCEEIVDLGSGRTYVCGRHTKHRDRRCDAHRPAEARRKEATG